MKDDQSISVTPAGPHPFTAGIGPFQIVDETYKIMYMSPRIKPLLTTDHPTSDTSLAWIGPCTTRGWSRSNSGTAPAFGNPSYRTLVHNAVLWAAGKIK